MRQRHEPGSLLAYEAKLAFAAVIGLCLLLSLVTLLGWDQGVTAGHETPWRSGGTVLGGIHCYLHTVLQWVCVAIGVATMGVGFVHYVVKRDGAALLVIVGLYLAALVELLYILAADGMLISGVNLEWLLPALWSVSRLVRVLLLGGVCLLMLTRVRHRLTIAPRALLSSLLIGSLLFLSLGAFLIYLLSFGSTTAGGAGRLQIIHILTLLLFMVVGIVVFPRFYRQFPSYTALALITTAVPDVMAQVHTLVAGRELFDAHFHVAVIFKTIGYVLPLIGLVADYYRSYEEEGEAVGKFREAEQRLKTRLLELEDSTQRLVEDESEREAAEKAFRVLDRAIAASSCGIIITDPRELANQIIYVNPAFERITGYAAEEAIGRNLDFLYAQEKEQPAAQEVADAIADARECRVIIRNYRKDGRMIWSELDISPVPDENGLLSHYLGIMTDITDRVRAEEEHKTFMAKLEHTNRELQDFVHVASHDLQEPLRKVQVFGDRLRAKCEPAIPKEGLMYLERMQNSVRRMDRLIRDLLTYSRIGRKEQQFSQVNLNAVLRDVLSDLEVRVEETNGEVTSDELPTVEADPTQMRQLLQNLVGNALKFHRDGQPPQVKIWAEHTVLPIDGQPQPHVQLYVKDNGIGFDEKYLERIFTVFQRLHTGNQYEGTGLGLTVCRKICERHGGRIAGKSNPGEGATFVVTLPLTRHP